MLFMVIEHIRDIDAVAARFAASGRMLPEGVEYIASWGELDGARWFQLMESPDAAALVEWTKQWDDLVEFELLPVLSSQDFWRRRDRGPG